MGLPSINITFQTLGITAVQRSQKGVVALILRDSKAAGGHTLANITEIPAELGTENKAQISFAFMGYISPPRRVLLYVIDEEQTLDDALTYYASQQFDYLAGPPDLTTEETGKIVSWIKSERLNDHMVKAVLPDIKADSEAVVNFTGKNIEAGTQTYAAAQYCARMAGLIAGTPMTISCTYAPLPEVTGIHRLSKAEADTAIDAGEMILYHDGEKVKVGRGVNSLSTVTQDKGETFKKIKIVEVVDMVKNDIRITVQDSYIGKYANSYDNKCLLIMAVKGYFEGLEQSGILERGQSSVEIDLIAQENYLKSTGTDTEKMSEQEIKTANTGSKVFLKAKIVILDAIEDIDLAITI